MTLDGLPGVTVIEKRNIPVRIVKQGIPVTTILKRIHQIHVTAHQPIQWTPVNIPFDFVSLEGQTDFELDYAPRENGVIVLAVNGILQSQSRGDFAIEGTKTIRFESGLDSGDIVTGVYERA